MAMVHDHFPRFRVSIAFSNGTSRPVRRLLSDQNPPDFDTGVERATDEYHVTMMPLHSDKPPRRSQTRSRRAP